MSKELWEISKGPGQPPKFSSPQEMWDRAVEYFKWCGQHQLVEEKIGFFQGEPTSGFVGHKRPMTQKGLCIFLGITVSTWHNYKKNTEYLEVIEAIEDIMFEQKFAGAAVGLFNANIIARDLGLADKQDITTNGESITKSMSDDDFADQLEKLGVKFD